MESLKRLATRNNYLLLAAFIVFWTPLIIFFKIAGEVIERDPIPFDIEILRWLHVHSSQFLDALFLTFTTIGGAEGMVVIMAVLLGYYLYKKQRTRALLVFASVGGAAAANLILKALFQRDRPSLFRSEVIETSFSFPSGHAMASMALALCLVLIYWRTKWRWLVVVVSGLFVLMVGVSRPYFGVHYPSDIIAGWCASIGWVLLVFYVVHEYKLRFRTS